VANELEFADDSLLQLIKHFCNNDQKMKGNIETRSRRKHPTDAEKMTASIFEVLFSNSS